MKGRPKLMKRPALSQRAENFLAFCNQPRNWQSQGPQATRNRSGVRAAKRVAASALTQAPDRKR